MCKGEARETGKSYGLRWFGCFDLVLTLIGSYAMS